MVSLKYLLCYATSAIFVSAETTLIKVLFLSYDKSNITIVAGDTVQWSWLSSAHSVTQGTHQGSCEPLAGGFDSSVLDAGSNFSVVFSNPGIYYYHSNNGLNCRSGMVGEVNVGSLNNGVLTLPSRPKPALDSVSAASTASIGILHFSGITILLLAGLMT